MFDGIGFLGLSLLALVGPGFVLGLLSEPETHSLGLGLVLVLVLVAGLCLAIRARMARRVEK